MHKLSLVLKLIAPAFLVVSGLHLSMGAGADVLLGAQLSESVLSDPVLDSQNRFYGVAFGLYGVLLYLCATDLGRYIHVLHCLLGVFFVAGIARLLSIYLHGVPSWAVVGLLLIELVGPVVLWTLLARLDIESAEH